MITIMVTGHRPKKLEKDLYGNVVYEHIEKFFMSAFLQFAHRGLCLINGGALGVDQAFGKCGLMFKKQYPHYFVHNVLSMPHLGQADRWTSFDQRRFKQYKESMDEVIVLSEKYSSRVMQDRNKYMVDRSDIVLAVWDKSKSGTKNCINYARQKNKHIIAFHPLTHNIIVINDPKLKKQTQLSLL